MRKDQKTTAEVFDQIEKGELNDSILKNNCETNYQEIVDNYIGSQDKLEGSFCSDEFVGKEEKVKIDINLTRVKELTPLFYQLKSSKSIENLADKSSHINDENKIWRQNYSSNITKSTIYQIKTDKNSMIKLPNNYNTEDLELKTLCDLINENIDFGWIEVYIQDNISIYRKYQQDNPTIMLKTYATIDGFSKDEVFQAISNVSIRKKWDKIFSEFKIIENEEDKEYLYMVIKAPSIFISDRDFVQQRKIWNNFPDNESVIIHFKSVDHPRAPENSNIVRAHTFISGYFIKTVSKDPLKTTVSIISQTDIKGLIPKWLVNSFAQKAPKEWISNLITGCGMVRSRNSTYK